MSSTVSFNVDDIHVKITKILTDLKSVRYWQKTWLIFIFSLQARQELVDDEFTECFPTLKYLKKRDGWNLIMISNDENYQNSDRKNFEMTLQDINEV